MTRRLVILDADRGGLSRQVAALEKSGFTVERFPGPPPDDLRQQRDLQGVLIHHRRSREITPLIAAQLPPGVPVVVWFPKGTPADQVRAWSRTGAADFLVGSIDPKGLNPRLEGLAGASLTRSPWMREALETLFEISRTVTSREDDLTVLSSTASQFEKLFPGTQCSILMISPELHLAHVVTQGGTSELLDIPLELARYPEVEKVLATHRSVAIKDVKRHPLMKEVRQFIRAKDLHSILSVPIFYRDEVIGLIMVRSASQPRSFSRFEISICETIAQSTAVALKNLRLGREVAEEVRRTREAERVARKKSNDLARLEAFFDHASDGIVVVNGKGRIRSTNVNFNRLSGFAKGELQGKNLDEMLFPAPGETLNIARAVKDKSAPPQRTTQVLHCRDGRRLTMAVRIEYLSRSQEWLISLHDVTEEKELDEALRRTKDFLENMIQSSMDAIIAADMNGTIIVFNQAAESISGYRAEDVLGKMNIVDLYAPRVARAIMRKLRSPEYGGRGKLETTGGTLIGADGGELPINMSASIIYEEGREVATVGIFQDLRERIRIEKELRDAQEKLMAAQQREALTALSGAASHELNQPLTSIMGYAELLKRVERNLARDLPGHGAVASLKNAVDVIEQEAERMAQVVKKLGEVSIFETREYVGGARIVDLDRARGEGPDEALEVYQVLFQHTQDSVMVIGEDTMVRLANPAAVALAEENPVGKSFTRYFEGLEYQKAMDVFAQVRQGKTLGFELEGLTASGNRRLLKGAAMPMPGRQRYLVIYRDVAERRKAEAMLRDLSAFQDQLTRSASLPLVAFDVDGKISYWNRAAEKMFGYTFEEVRGKPPEGIIFHFDPNALQDVFRKLRREGEQAGELTVTRRNGENFRIYHVDSVMRDEDGEATGFLSMLFDLSQQREFEREIKQKTEHIAVITEIAEAVRTGVGIDESLGGVLRKLGRLVPLDHAAITMAEPDSDLILVIHYDGESEAINKSTLRIYDDARFILDRLFSPEPAIIDDTNEIDHTEFPGDVGKGLFQAKESGLRSLINYPLIFGNEVLGTLHVLSTEPGRYHRKHIELLDQAAGPIAMALAHTRMFNQIESQNIELYQRTRWMEELIRAGQSIGLEMRAEDVVSRLLAPYARAHQSQHLTAWTFEQGEDKLRLAALHNYPALKVGRAARPEDKVLAQAREAREAVEIDLTQDPEHQPLLAGARSALLVPILAPDRRLGAMLLESHHQRSFSENEKIEVQILAANIAGALRNLYFYRDLDLALRFQRGLIEDANALILVINREGRVTLVNRALAELLGQPSEAFTGALYEDLFDRHFLIEVDDLGVVTPRDRSFKKLLKGVMRGEGMVNIRISIRSADGRESRAVFNSSSILDREGGYQGFIAIGQNMTRFQQLEQHLLQSEKMATVGQMAAGIAHDLNNPLTGLINAASVLNRSQDLDKRSRFLLEQIIEGAQRIDALAQNLMSYSRPTREQMFPINLRQMLLDALSFSHYELSRGKVTVETNLPDGMPAIKGIKDQLQQVFINLLTNASHACADQGGGKVAIEASQPQPELIEVRISDDGAGIDPANLDKLFDPFFTTKPEGKGTGLGLTIVKEIVSRHEGRIQVESEPGRGAAFTVTLPVWTNANDVNHRG